MTNEQTIEKLNDALTQLIEAYEILVDKNDKLKKDIEVKNEIISDLENKLDEINGTTEVQSTKMDGMLSRIQSLLSTSDTEVSSKKDDEEDEIDLRIEPGLDFNNESKNDDGKSNENKIDLGRMESLLNGLNTK
jgi:uncharacterized coiled-coil protein SlyX